MQILTSDERQKVDSVNDTIEPFRPQVTIHGQPCSNRKWHCEDKLMMIDGANQLQVNHQTCFLVPIPLMLFHKVIQSKLELHI